MANYQNGKLYKITSAMTNKIYIGATIVDFLSKVIANHRYARFFEFMASHEILQYDDADIYLISHAPCSNKDEFQQIKKACMDKHISEGFILTNKVKPIIKTCECGASYKNKRDHFETRKHKQYLETTSHEPKPDTVKYQFIRNGSTPHNCECGGKYIQNRIKNHQNTKKHKDFMNAKLVAS